MGCREGRSDRGKPWRQLCATSHSAYRKSGVSRAINAGWDCALRVSGARSEAFPRCVIDDLVAHDEGLGAVRPEFRLHREESVSARQCGQAVSGRDRLTRMREPYSEARTQDARSPRRDGSDRPSSDRRRPPRTDARLPYFDAERSIRDQWSLVTQRNRNAAYNPAMNFARLTATSMFQVPFCPQSPWDFDLKGFGLGHGSEPEGSATFSYSLVPRPTLGLVALPHRQGRCIPEGWRKHRHFALSVRLRYLPYSKAPPDPDEASWRFSNSLTFSAFYGPALQRGCFIL